MPARAPSEVEFQVLLALAGGDRHGYAIMREVARQSGGRVGLGPGTLYGAVRRMSEAGWIVEVEPPRGARADARRTCDYHITAAGRRAASDAASRLAEVVAVAAELGLLKGGRGGATATAGGTA